MKDQTTIVSVATVEIVELCSHKNSSVQLDTALCLYSILVLTGFDHVNFFNKIRLLR